MTPAQYLLDTSAVVRLLREPEIQRRWQASVTAGLVAICPIVELEVLYSARSLADRKTIETGLRRLFGWAVMPDNAFTRAAAVQAELTQHGTHRSAGPVDLLIAATAEEHRLTLIHYDRDFEAVAAVTSQPMAWLAQAGSID